MRPQKVLRLPSVVERVGISRSTIYEMQFAGDFPKPIKLGKRSVGWLEADIDKWLATRVALSVGDLK